MTQTVIVGAGASGLAAARHLAARGHDCTILERESQLGGVWAPWRRYPGLSTQTPRDQFVFSDFPAPPGQPEWPSASDQHRYLEDYAERFDLDDTIVYDTEVVGLDPHEDGTWTVHTRHSGLRGSMEADRVVIGTGPFDQGHLPEVPGREEFEAAGGTVRHSIDCTTPDQLRGEVVVVGYQKSAVDLATYAAAHGAQVHLICRRVRWKLPRYVAGRWHIGSLVMSRFAEYVVSATTPPGDEGRTWWDAALPRAARGMLRAAEWVVDRQFGLRTHGLLPGNHLESEVHCGLSLEPPGFFDHVRNGTIRVHHGEIERLGAEGIRTSRGTSIRASSVIYATGLSFDLGWLPPTVLADVCDVQGRLALFRNILPPRRPTLGFVGFASSFVSLLSAEACACWLGEFWAGRLDVPTAEAMERQVAEELADRLARWPAATTSTRNACVGVPGAFLETLVTDMGRVRTARGLLDALRPLDPSTYADCFAVAPSRSGREQPPPDLSVSGDTELIVGGD